MGGFQFRRLTAVFYTDSPFDTHKTGLNFKSGGSVQMESVKVKHHIEANLTGLEMCSGNTAGGPVGGAKPTMRTIWPPISSLIFKGGGAANIFALDGSHDEKA